VPPDDERAGLADLLVAAGEDLDEDLGRELLVGEADDRERRERLAADGVAIRERVGRGDPAEAPRVVDDRREEIDRLDERAARVDPEDGGVRRVLGADEQVRVRRRRESGEDGPQDLGAQLRRSPAAGDGLGEARAFPERAHGAESKRMRRGARPG